MRLKNLFAVRAAALSLGISVSAAACLGGDLPAEPDADRGESPSESDASPGDVDAGDPIAADAEEAPDAAVVDGGPAPTFRFPGSQTAFCSDGQGEVDCPTSGDLEGQDGDYRIRVPDYEVGAEEGIVFDSMTRFAWTLDLQEADTFADAEAHCASVADDEVDGRSDWRVPDRFEVVTLLDVGRVDPSLPEVLGEAPQPAHMWTSTPDAADPERFWALSTGVGFLTPIDGENPPFSSHVRCVSGEVPPRTIESDGDDTAVDTRTELVWQTAPVAAEASFAGALKACEELELDGHHDWRLASAKELYSLVDDTRVDPAFDAIFDLPGDTLQMWTSSPNAKDPSQALIVNVSSGANALLDMENSGTAALCVRGPEAP